MSDVEQLDSEQDVTLEEAQKALHQLKKFTFALPNVSERYVECTMELSTMLTTEITKRMLKKRQSKIYNFFVNKP